MVKSVWDQFNLCYCANYHIHKKQKMDIVLSIKKQYNLAHGDTKYERKRRAEQSTSARYANLRQSESASRKSNLREQISARRARAGEGELEGEAMRRRRGQVNEQACARARRMKEKIEENLQCRIAAHSRASILSFGPVYRNLHGKLPREERARERTQET